MNRRNQLCEKRAALILQINKLNQAVYAIDKEINAFDKSFEPKPQDGASYSVGVKVEVTETLKMYGVKGGDILTYDDPLPNDPQPWCVKKDGSRIAIDIKYLRLVG